MIDVENFDLEKTKLLYALCMVPPQDRNQNWRESFLDAIANASMVTLPEQVVKAGDGFFYFALALPTPGENIKPFSLSHVLDFCLENGCGVVINPSGKSADWVFSYGDLWSYSLTGSFYPEQLAPKKVEFADPKAASQKAMDEFDQEEDDDQVLVGAPNEELLPAAARKVLRDFCLNLKVYQGRVPQIFLMADPNSAPVQSLVFNFHAQDFDEEPVYRQLMMALSWYIPKGLGLVGIPKESHMSSHFKDL